MWKRLKFYKLDNVKYMLFSMAGATTNVFYSKFQKHE